MRMLVIRSFCRLSGQVSSRFMLKSGASSSFIRSSLNGNSTMSRRSLFESVVRPQLDKRKLEHLQTRLRMKRTTKELEQLADFEAELAKLGFFKRYMKLLGNYYHVVFTVHAITSAGWMALFYIMSQYFGISPKPLVEYFESINIHIPMSDFMKKETVGALASCLLFYKFAAPLRYATTVFFTMTAIRRLMPKGLIRPKKFPESLRKLLESVGLRIP